MWTLYEHAKGGLYLGLGRALHSETEAAFERYLCLYDAPKGQAWIRPEAMFHEVLPTGSARFRPIARVRVADPEDLPTVLSFGWDAWGEGRPMDEFVASYERSRDHLTGTRYLIETLEGAIRADLNVLRFRRGLLGVASVATDPAHRGQGFATRLLRAVMALHREEQPGVRFLLFSEVDPKLYERVGFAVLPDEHQRHRPSLAMATGLAERPLDAEESRFLERYF